MTLLEMKKKVLQLIEEIDTENEKLTSDPDIEAKLNSVINQVQFEVARMRKIPAYKEMEIEQKQVFDLNTLERFYQLRLLRFTGDYELLENLVAFSEAGIAVFYYYVLPEVITDETPDTYVFDLPQDALEIIPYGVASDILKSDASTSYGAVYTQRYETMLQRLDPRYSMASITIEGGVDI